jgi:hypothetical protein
MRRHAGARTGVLPRRTRREELVALRYDLAYLVGVLSDVLRGRPYLGG